MGDTSYQSPIHLQKIDSIKIEQSVHCQGTNQYAEYDAEDKVYRVTNNILLKIGKKHYKLHEYHFHVPCEHIIDNRKFPSEIHYVFMEIDGCEKESPLCDYGDFCGCNHRYPNNVLVIARLINDIDDCADLSKLQVKIPSCYYEYDGTLTTEPYSPAKWIIGKTSIYFNTKQLILVAKPSRPLQELNGRLVLYSD